jgi:hypothetical protein
MGNMSGTEIRIGSLDDMLDNYINGNLQDAKDIAKKYSTNKILCFLGERGYSMSAAHAIADFLKGNGSFQDAANAEFNQDDE